MIDLSPFDNFDTFFSWYINIIKSKVPDFLSLTSDEIHARMGKLSDEEFKFVCKSIRKIQPLPAKIGLRNDNKQGTFYATFDKANNKPVIAFPTVMLYWLKYPPIVKAIILHELGHCVGEIPDILSDTKAFTDHSLVNISMDVRINANIDYDTLAQVYKCTYTFDNSFFEMQYVPEYWMPNKCGLPASLKTKATWTWLYKSYQDFNPKGESPVDETKKELVLGDYVETLVDKYGYPKGTYGIVTQVLPIIGGKEYVVSSITNAEIEAFKNDDYEYFERLAQSPPLSRTDMGKYDYNPPIKGIVRGAGARPHELKILKVPVFQKNKPKQGDIAIIITDKTFLRKNTFGMVVNKVSANIYTIREFVDEIQNIIKENNYDLYVNALMTSTDPFKSNQENCMYPKEFILHQLSSPPPPPPPEPPREKQLEMPQEGDIVVISEGSSKGKYGIILEINGDNYTIQEVDEETAKLKTGRKF